MIKHKGTFVDQEGKKFEVLIHTEAWIDDEIEEGGEVVLAASPFTVNYPSTDLYKGVKGSTATIGIIQKSYNLDFNSKAGDVYVELRETESGKVRWCGYATPTAYNQGFDGVWSDFELECIDSLSYLKNVPYSTIQPGVKKLVTVGEIFRKSLLQSCYGINKMIVSNSVGVVGDGGSFLDQSLLSEENFFDESGNAMSFYEVLEEIAKIFSLSIIQFEDKAYILDYNSLLVSSDYVDTGNNPNRADRVKVTDYREINIDFFSSGGVQLETTDVQDEVEVEADFYKVKERTNLWEEKYLIPQESSKNQMINVDKDLRLLPGTSQRFVNHFQLARRDKDRNVIEWFNLSMAYFLSDSPRLKLYQYDPGEIKLVSYKKTGVTITDLVFEYLAGERISEEALDYFKCTHEVSATCLYAVSQKKVEKPEELELPDGDPKKYIIFTNPFILKNFGLLVPSLELLESTLPTGTSWIRHRSFSRSQMETYRKQQESIISGLRENMPDTEVRMEYTEELFLGIDSDTLRINGSFTFYDCDNNTVPIDYNSDRDRPKQVRDCMFVWSKLQIGNRLWWDGESWLSRETKFKLPLEFKEENTVIGTFPIYGRVGTETVTKPTGYEIPLPKVLIGSTVEVKISFYHQIGVWKDIYPRVTLLEGLTISAVKLDSFINLDAFEFLSGKKSRGEDTSNTVYRNNIQRGSGSKVEKIKTKINTFDGKAPNYSGVIVKDGGELRNLDKFYNVGNQQLLRGEEHIVCNRINQFSTPCIALSMSTKSEIYPYSVFTYPSQFPGKNFVVQGWSWDVDSNRKRIKILEKKKQTYSPNLIRVDTKKNYRRNGDIFPEGVILKNRQYNSEGDLEIEKVNFSLSLRGDGCVWYDGE